MYGYPTLSLRQYRWMEFVNDPFNIFLKDNKVLLVAIEHAKRNTPMRTIELHISDDLLTQSIQYLKYFVSHHKNSDFTYRDDMGDMIQVVDGVEYVIPSQEDQQAMNAPLAKDDLTSLEALKKELCIA